MGRLVSKLAVPDPSDVDVSVTSPLIHCTCAPAIGWPVASTFTVITALHTMSLLQLVERLTSDTNNTRPEIPANLAIVFFILPVQGLAFRTVLSGFAAK